MLFSVVMVQQHAKFLGRRAQMGKKPGLHLRYRNALRRPDKAGIAGARSEFLFCTTHRMSAARVWFCHLDGYPS